MILYDSVGKLPELIDRLTMLLLVIVGTRSAEHSLRSQVGIGSESHLEKLSW